MKALHLADLHIGKRIFGYSMIEDQRYFFDKTYELVLEEKIEIVLIAGDIYDNGTPSAEAMTVLDEFLSKLSKAGIKVLLIPGNHDVAERFNYGASFFKNGGIYMINDVKDSLNPLVLDGVNFYLVPFINHHDVNRLLNTEYKTYEEAFIGLIENMKLDKNKTNVLVAHQLVLPVKGDVLREGSEDPVIGSLGNISSSIFNDFDYVALGHIHKPQNVGKNMRYPGSPLAYHSDESNFEKSYTILNIEEKNITFSIIPINPLRRVTVLTGTLEDVLTNNPDAVNDYVYVRLTNDSTIENLMAKIKAVYPYAMNVEYSSLKALGVSSRSDIAIDDIKIDDLFFDFYQKQNGIEVSDYQKELVSELLGGVKL